MILQRLAVAIAAATCATASAQSSGAPRCANPETERALHAIAAEWKASYNEGDSARLARLYDETAWYLTQHFIDGAIYGRSAIRAWTTSAGGGCCSGCSLPTTAPGPCRRPAWSAG